MRWDDFRRSDTIEDDRDGGGGGFGGGFGILGGGGFAQAAMGPFYCPSDRRIYLDTSFFRAIETRFRGCQGKACKFAQAYVIAHEAGHHVQNLLGVPPPRGA